MYQCRFISCNKCTTLVRDVDNGGGCANAGKGYKENLVSTIQFCYESITPLKSKVYLKMKSNFS